MKISKDLRLVIPVETEQGHAYVHAQAVSREVYERYCPVVLRAFTQIMKHAGDITGAPKVAATYIRRAAEQMGIKDDVESGLMAEITRLANVAVLGASGWEMVSLDDVHKKGMIDDDDWSEVENTLAFFTLGFFMVKKIERELILTEVAGIWGGRITSSSFTEFKDSLPTSTATGSSGESPAASSPPH